MPLKNARRADAVNDLGWRRWGSPGRVSSYRTSLSAALSLPSRAAEAPPVRKRAALPDLLGYRTSFAREGQHPKVSATRRISTMRR